MKILITDKLAKEGIDLLKSIPDVEAVVKTGISEDELSQIIGEHDGLIIRSGTKVTAKVLASPGKFRAVARAGVGIDNIDVKEATRKGVLVMNTPGAVIRQPGIPGRIRPTEERTDRTSSVCLHEAFQHNRSYLGKFAANKFPVCRHTLLPIRF